MGVVAETVTPNRKYGAWESCKIGGGGYLQDICYAPSDATRIYVLSDVGGVFRSDDAGEHWHMLHGALPAAGEAYAPRSLWIDTKNPDLIVLATGTKWVSQPGAEKHAGLYRSEDGGQTWQQVAGGLYFEGDGHMRRGGTVLCEGSDGTLYAAPLGTSIHKSTDKGRTWQKLSSPLFAPTHILADRDNPKRIWVCSAPWDSKHAAGAKLAKQIETGMFVSEDGGATWQKMSEPNPPVEFVQSPKDAKLLYGLSDGTKKGTQVFRSTDGGITWQPFVEGLPPCPEKWNARKDGIYTSLFFAGDALVLGGSGGSIYELEGNRWEKIVCEKLIEDGWWGATKADQKLGEGHAGCALGHMAVNPKNPNAWAFTDWYAVYFTEDRGKTWRLSIDGIEMTVVHAVTQDTVKPERMHIGVADVGYYRSEDCGLDLAWGKNIGNNTKTISPSPVNKGRIYATGPIPFGWFANHVFVSDDSGVTWRRTKMKGLPEMNARRCNTIVADPKDPDKVWLGVTGPVSDEKSEGGVYVSYDGAETWEYLKGQVANPGIFRKEIFQGNEELAVANDGSMIAISINSKRLYAVDKPGNKWRRYKLPDDAPPNTVVADPHEHGRIYLGLRWGHGLYQTDDAGLHWKKIYKNDVSHIAVNRFKQGYLAVISGGQVALSRDGGKTWTHAPDGLPYRHHRNVVGFAGDYVTVGTGGSGVFRIPMTAFTETPKPMGEDTVLEFQRF